MTKTRIRALTCCAVCVALAFILSNVKLFMMPQGGSVTACSMFFIALAGFWFGPAAGIASGAALGFLELILGGYVVHPAQMLLDYPLAYGALGLSGCFREMRHGLTIGYTAGAAARFFMAFLSGIIFFASYTPEGQNTLLYSAGYNISYIWPEALFTMIIVSIPAFREALARVRKMIM